MTTPKIPENLGFGGAGLTRAVLRKLLLGLRKRSDTSHNALIRLLNYIKSNGLNLKVALMVEPWPDIVHGSPQQPGTARNLSAVRKQMVLDYVWDNIYNVYPGLIFHWDGKPPLATVGELYFDLNEDAPDDCFTLRSFRFKAEDIDPGNAWNWIITEPLPYFQAVDNTIILSPRYDEWFLAAAHPKWWEAGAWGWTEPLRRDPYLTENLYDFQWRQVYDRREETDLVILWAWNSWMEQLYIEPDNEQGAAPAGDMLLLKTAWYARRLMSGAPSELMEPDWVSVQDFRSVLTPIAPAQLNLESDAEVDQLLHRIIQQAQSHVATYLNRTFGDISIPDAVREVTLRVASSIYNYMIATKSGNLVRFGEVGVDVLSNTVFTEAMRRDLRPLRKAPTIGVWSP